jgi:hypothetical protein
VLFVSGPRLSRLRPVDESRKAPWCGFGRRAGRLFRTIPGRLALGEALGRRMPNETKPFSSTDEASLKPRSAPIVGNQTMESIMLATFLNAIYREFLRTALSGAKIAGA